MEKHGRDRLTSGIWERALEHGDPLAEHLIDRAIEALGAGIASAVNLLDPEAVIIGGGLGVRFGEQYGPRSRRSMQAPVRSTSPPPVQVAAPGRPRRRDRRRAARQGPQEAISPLAA